MDKKLLIVGLMNPGRQFESTYHNAGERFIDFLALRHNLHFRRPGLMAKFSYASTNRLILVKPLTYMNESGLAVKAALAYFKLTPADLIVAHDEVDLAVGKFKLSEGGGSAGHKGVASVIDRLGTPDFRRLRVGIGPEIETDSKAEGRKTKAGDFVLKKISPEDSAKINSAIEAAAELIESY